MPRRRAARPVLVIATHNRHKVREIRNLLGRVSYDVKGLEGWPAYAVRETGRTLAANALLKARAARRRTGHVCLADDTGLEVKALGGGPGVFSARYAGPRCSYDDNNRKLLRRLRGERGRTARFRCAVAVVFPDGRERLFEGRCPGSITMDPCGRRGFGYDPIFAPRGARGKTFAEMSLREKNRVSHRARAFAAARDFLKGLFRRSPRRFLSRPVRP